MEMDDEDVRWVQDDDREFSTKMDYVSVYRLVARTTWFVLSVPDPVSLERRRGFRFKSLAKSLGSYNWSDQFARPLNVERKCKTVLWRVLNV